MTVKYLIRYLNDSKIEIIATLRPDLDIAGRVNDSQISASTDGDERVRIDSNGNFHFGSQRHTALIYLCNNDKYIIQIDGEAPINVPYDTIPRNDVNLHEEIIEKTKKMLNVLFI